MGTVLVPHDWDFGSLPLVAAIADGGNRSIVGETVLLLSFKVLGSGGGASMVTILGVVFMVEGDMVVQQIMTLWFLCSG